jgi:hypothetical protein
MLRVDARKMKKTKKTSTTTIISISPIYSIKFNINNKNTKFFI